MILPLSWISVRFGMVGAATAVIYVALFTLLSNAGLTTPASSALAFTLAVLFQFVGHRSFTFRAGASVGRSIQRFVVSNALTLVLGTALATLFRDVAGMGTLVTGMLVSLALMVFNWHVFRNWVFKA